MDAKKMLLKEKLDYYMKEAAAVATELQALEQGAGTPHYDQIELPAHDMGKQLSRMIQTQSARDVAANGLEDVPCPKCGGKCRVETKTREINSMDGPVDLTETVAFCRPCRRSFFPSAC